MIRDPDDDDEVPCTQPFPEPRRRWPSSRRPLERLFRVAVPDLGKQSLETYLRDFDMVPGTSLEGFAIAAAAAHVRHFLTTEDVEDAEWHELFHGAVCCEGWWN